MYKSIIIVGAGPVGLITALKLAKLGKTVTVLDKRINSTIQDGRVLALSYATCQLLRDLGIWDSDLATPIHQVHISHSGLGVSRLTAGELGLTELGYTISYARLCQELKHEVSKYGQIELMEVDVQEISSLANSTKIAYRRGQDSIIEYLDAEFVILAEGGGLALQGIEYKQYDYNQVAIITHIYAKHTNMAFERFDDSGSLVLLPHQDHYVMIWIRNQEDNLNGCLTNSANLEHELFQLKFMKRFMPFSIDQKIHSFPLKLQVADRRVSNRVVLIGNSAQIVHPISAQGLNLAIRDSEELLQLLFEIDYDYTKLDGYNQKRKLDAKFVTRFTHVLARVLEYPAIKHFRGAGLIGFSNLPFLKKKIARSLIFGY